MVTNKTSKDDGNAVDYSLLQSHERKQETTLQFKLETYQRIIREWMGHLSLAEFALAMQIADRTIGWGQFSATITTGALLKGGGAYAGTKISRRSLFRTLTSLEERGVIKRRKSTTGVLRISITPGWSPDMVNLPKRLQGKAEEERCQSDTDQCQCGTSPCQCGTLYTGNLSTGNQITDTAASEDGGNLANSSPDKKEEGSSPQSPPSKIVKPKIHAATETNTAARKAKANRNRGQTDVSAGIEAVWRDALAETFPGSTHLPWDVRQKRNVKLKAKGWSSGSQITFDDLVDWSVHNWTRIIKKQFDWMKEKAPPATPDIGFFLYFAPKFLEVWADREFSEWLAAPERTDVEKHMAKGMTREEAEAEILQKRAEHRMEDRNRKSEAKASKKHREAKMIRAQAERIAEVHVPSRRRRPKTDLKISGETGHADIQRIPLAKKNPFDVD